MLIWPNKVEHYKTKHQEQFWSGKFTSNSNLNGKVENYELKKMKCFENIYKKEKKYKI